ncbi:MAG: uncharacterized protein A8A55_1918 [Amphiamblys sp. WSBS2006]|nr:MAG: uncharacterized protein A8A55_1918 [Amphiamblys sp. WSBS2006]
MLQIEKSSEKRFMFSYTPLIKETPKLVDERKSKSRPFRHIKSLSRPPHRLLHRTNPKCTNCQESIQKTRKNEQSANTNSAHLLCDACGTKKTEKKEWLFQEESPAIRSPSLCDTKDSDSVKENIKIAEEESSVGTWTGCDDIQVTLENAALEKGFVSFLLGSFDVSVGENVSLFCGDSHSRNKTVETTFFEETNGTDTFALHPRDRNADAVLLALLPEHSVDIKERNLELVDEGLLFLSKLALNGRELDTIRILVYKKVENIKEKITARASKRLVLTFSAHAHVPKILFPRDHAFDSVTVVSDGVGGDAGSTYGDEESLQFVPRFIEAEKFFDGPAEHGDMHLKTNTLVLEDFSLFASPEAMIQADAALKCLVISISTEILAWSFLDTTTRAFQIPDTSELRLENFGILAVEKLSCAESKGLETVSLFLQETTPETQNIFHVKDRSIALPKTKRLKIISFAVLLIPKICFKRSVCCYDEMIISVSGALAPRQLETATRSFFFGTRKLTVDEHAISFLCFASFKENTPLREIEVHTRTGVCGKEAADRIKTIENKTPAIKTSFLKNDLLRECLVR